MEGAWAIPLALSFLCIGEFALATLGAEVFNQIGQAIKAASPASYTMVASPVNGCIGYLPSEQEAVLGGYEVDLAPFFYRLPGKLLPSTAYKVIQEMGLLSQEPRDQPFQNLTDGG